MRDTRLEKLAKLLVNYSTKVQPGDKVFISCDEVAIPWMIEVTKAAIEAGGHVETLLSNQDVAEAKLKYASDSQLSYVSSLMEFVVDEADVLLSAWGGRNTRINSNIDPEKLKLRQKSESRWRIKFIEGMTKGDIRWCGTMFPTHSDAQEANMSLSDYEDFVYGAGLLDKEDPITAWLKFSKSQDKWVDYLNTRKEIHIVSIGTDIKCSVAGRTWINCDGRINFPDGEIYTCPVEDSVQGYITFSFPGIYQGKEIEGIRLEVEKGKVVKATADKGEDLLQALLETDEGASFFGELAIGTNYGIQQFTRNMLFDEKIGGTVHMAVGNAAPHAGGENKSAIHWDMLCDMRKEGKIYGDGELFYKDGQFIDIK